MTKTGVSTVIGELMLTAGMILLLFPSMRRIGPI